VLRRRTSHECVEALPDERSRRLLVDEATALVNALRRRSRS
jgi:hypothetical protein